MFQGPTYICGSSFCNTYVSFFCFSVFIVLQYLYIKSLVSSKTVLKQQEQFPKVMRQMGMKVIAEKKLQEADYSLQFLYQKNKRQHTLKSFYKSLIAGFYADTNRQHFC